MSFGVTLLHTSPSLGGNRRPASSPCLLSLSCSPQLLLAAAAAARAMGLPEGAVDHGSTVTPIKDHAALAELASLREQAGESGGLPATPGAFCLRHYLFASLVSADASPFSPSRLARTLHEMTARRLQPVASLRPPCNCSERLLTDATLGFISWALLSLSLCSLPPSLPLRRDEGDSRADEGGAGAAQLP